MKKEEEILITFEDKKTLKTVDAYLYQGAGAEVMLQSSLKDETLFDPVSSDIEPEEHVKGFEAVEQTARELLECTNDSEVSTYIDQRKDLISLKSFGGEYVIVMLGELRGICRLDSIYLNMDEKRFSNHCFFGMYIGTSNLRIEKVEGDCHLFADDNLYSMHFIMHGEELPSSLSIRFPSGMCGNGGWDFSHEFDR